MGKRGLLLICLLFISIILISYVSATADVAYIYKNKLAIDNNIINTFNEMGLSVDKIPEKNLTGTKPVNLTKYRFIFVGDERFSYYNKIPIGDVPIVIMNGYFGPDWGLTDRGGISQLTSNTPLYVMSMKDGLKQVYIQARYTLGGIFIPYYYLANENKAVGMQKAAGTYTGNELDLGDVISYAPEGTNLQTGKKTKGKICFYGIIKTKYWTPEAKQLFKDCVGYVSSVCSSNLDCPGNETSPKYCINNDVYRNLTSFQCLNPGEINSQCLGNLVPQFIEHCSGACVDGSCYDITCRNNSDCDDSNIRTEDVCLNPGTVNSTCTHNNITCLNNADCGINGFIGNNFCNGASGKDLFRNFTSFTCNDAGKSTSFCTNSTSPVLNQTCSDICDNGQCKTIVCYNNSQCNDYNVWTEDICLNPGTYDSSCIHNDIKCFSNSDCGINTLSGNSCSGLNIVRNYLNFTCNNPGQFSSYCSNFSGFYLIQQCAQQCSLGQCLIINCTKDLDCNDNNPKTFDSCINPNTTASYCRNTDINCLNDNDCGISGFTGTEFCTGNSVAKQFKNSTCMNPGTLLSYCNVVSFSKILQTCSDSCTNGSCINSVINCYKDLDCNDNSNYTVDICQFPGTANSQCTNNLVNCLNDNDCGISGFIGSEFCSGLNIFKYYQNSTCVNPGTLNSNCNILISPLITQNCADSNPLTFDSCIEPPAHCRNNIIQCTNNSDCSGSGIITKFCVGNDVWNNVSQALCNNPGQINSLCSLTYIQAFNQTCPYGCSNGACLPGVHDVGIFNLRFTDLSDNPATDLIKDQKYKILFDAQNLGNFIENVSFIGTSTCPALSFTGSSNNFVVGDTQLKSYTNKNASCAAGNYNLTVTANLLTAIDNDFSNNILTKQFNIIVYGCNSDSDCNPDYIVNYCNGTSVYQNITHYNCISHTCVSSINSVFLQNCTNGCTNGICKNQTCPDELIGYWKFDNSSWLGKDYADSHHGSVVGNALFNGTDKIAGAGSLILNAPEGKDYIDIPNHNDLKFGQTYPNFTLEAWVKPKNISLDCNNWMGSCFKGIMGTWTDAGGSGGGISLALLNGKPLFWTGYALSTKIIMANTKLSADTWTHVVLTKSGNIYKFYVNGVQVTPELCQGGTISGNNCTNNAVINYIGNYDFTIGTDSTIRPISDRFVGKIDEAALFRKALSAPEVLEHYNSGLGKSVC